LRQLHIITISMPGKPLFNIKSHYLRIIIIKEGAALYYIEPHRHLLKVQRVLCLLDPVQL